MINKRPEQLKRLAVLFSNVANEIRMEVCLMGGHRRRTENVCRVRRLLTVTWNGPIWMTRRCLHPGPPFCLMSCEVTLSRRTVDPDVRWWIVCNDRLLNLCISPICLLPLDNHRFTVDSDCFEWCCSVNPAVHLTFKHNLPWLFSKCH